MPEAEPAGRSGRKRRSVAGANPFRRRTTSPRHYARRPRTIWTPLVPLVMVGAGLLFATSFGTANGTDLRSGRRVQIEQLIGSRNHAVKENEATAASLRQQINSGTAQQASRDQRVQRAQQRADRLNAPVGMTAVQGPGLTISLNDAPNTETNQLPAGAGVNDVIVHQQDVQAVVNALWAGGAEAITLMNQRLINTGAVRCVGNTLLLYGRTYSPPFVVSAIGPEASMRAALDASARVRDYRQAVADFGLGYAIRSVPTIRMPAYTGQISLPLTGGTR